MKHEHLEQLKSFMSTVIGTKRVLFYDSVESKRVDLAIQFSRNDDSITILDEGCSYDLKDLELIDLEILNSCLR